MIEHKYVVIEYYESDHGGKPGDEHNSLALHRVEDGEVQASDDGSPVTREEALEMLAAFDRPIHASVDVAEEDEELRNITEYDGDALADLAFLEAKTEAEFKVKEMLIETIAANVTSCKKILLERASSHGDTRWHMIMVSVRIDGVKRREELISLGLTNIPQTKLWVECYIYKSLSFVGSCLINKDM